MLSAFQGKTAIGQLLISRGSNVNATNSFGETALSLAAEAGHAAFVRLLLENGASTNCSAHGYSLSKWIKQSSGLPYEKIVAILGLLRS